MFESKAKLTVILCKNVASNLSTSIYELEHYLKNKSELGNYLLERFYNDGYHGLQDRRVLWDISVIAYMINKSWFVGKKISCPYINDDTSYELTTNNHLITIINDIKSDNIIEDMLYSLRSN